MIICHRPAPTGPLGRSASSFAIGIHLTQPVFGSAGSPVRLASLRRCRGFSNVLHEDRTRLSGLRPYSDGLANGSCVSLALARRALCGLNLGQRARTLPLLDRIATDASAVLPARVGMQLLHCRLAHEHGGPIRALVETGLTLLPEGARPGLRDLL